MKKILYVYDFEGWALYNVGKYWAGLIEDCACFTFVEFGKHEIYDPSDFDFVFWGCSYMAEKHFKRLYHLIVPRRAPRWNPSKNRHFITVIHDPCEIFPQKENWRKCRPRRINKIRSFAKIGVISNEMQQIMNQIGFSCQVIHTNSTISMRSIQNLTIEPLKIFARAKDIPRKNLGLFRRLQSDLAPMCAAFDGYFDSHILRQRDYIRLIDQYNCYICTSWQEGGPLPLMDAMRRGCTVLTTPVGQTNDLIEDGVTGFFCNSFGEFQDRIKTLAEEPERLLEMRRKAQLAVAERSDLHVRQQLIRFFDIERLDDR